MGGIKGLIHGISMDAFRLSTDTFYTLWRNHGDIFAAIRELEQNTGSAGYSWLNTSDTNKEPDKTAVQRAEQVLNLNTTKRTFERSLIRHAHISGNAYVFIQKTGNGKITGLDVLDSRTMRVVVTPTGEIVKWVQKVGSQTQDYKPEEILQWKPIVDPNNVAFGLSPLEPIMIDVFTDLAANVTNYAFFENDARPGSIYVLDEDLTDEEKEIAVEELKDQLKGADNKHKSIAVKGLKDVKEVSFSHKDMEFHMLRKFTTEKICSVLGVPKSVLNYTEDVNHSAGQEQMRKFWEGTIQPLQEELSIFMNTVLLPAIGVEGIKIEYVARTFDNREWTEASTRADVQQGILTINEAREARGYEKYDANKEGEHVDKPLIWGGLGVRPLEDIGVEVDASGLPTIESEDQAAKELLRIEKMGKRYKYGRQNPEKNQ